MLVKNQNPVAAILRGGGKASAAWLQSASPIAAEILASAGFDILIVDLEHAPGDIMSLICQIQAMKGEPAVPFVRVPWNDHVAIKRVLDAGAFGLIVPYVSTVAEAEAAVRAAKFPPQGLRGIAGSPRAAHYGDNPFAYFEAANREIMVLAQIETPDGARNLPSILSVEGLDGIFIGPTDLATTHGYLAKPDVPAIRAIIETMERQTIASGKVLVTICADFEDARAKYERGYNVIVLMHDTVTLGKLARAQVKMFRDQVASGGGTG